MASIVYWLSELTDYLDDFPTPMALFLDEIIDRMGKFVEKKDFLGAWQLVFTFPPTPPQLGLRVAETLFPGAEDFISHKLRIGGEINPAPIQDDDELEEFSPEQLDRFDEERKRMVESSKPSRKTYRLYFIDDALGRIELLRLDIKVWLDAEGYARLVTKSADSEIKFFIEVPEGKLGTQLTVESEFRQLLRAAAGGRSVYLAVD